MIDRTDPITQLIHQLGRLPGVGRKSATRLAYFLLQSNNGYPEKLADSLLRAQESVHACSVCGNLTVENPCPLCTVERPEPKTLCVVEQVPDLLAVESSGAFRGRYHILLGTISPLNGVGPDQLRIPELLERIEDEQIEEVIVATNPTVDGDTTALYLQKILSGKSVRVTRVASGLPAGSDIEYLDRETLSRAFSGRQELTS